jgi:tetratricopeptide (TPR) repeat protein
MKRSILAVAVFVPMLAQAQGLKLPQQSPAATVSQTVGLTEITVNYHRPAVGGRAIWGQLVPYGEMWRAGANENTTITFSTDAKVEGKAIKAGTYGLHMLPTNKQWTIAFSNMSAAWGSFTYDQKEDALRVTVTPRTTDTIEERLSYHFDNPTETAVTLVMSWEKLAVPLAITVDTPKVTMASARTELRGVLGYDDRANAAAAEYWLKNNGPADEGVKLVDKAIARRATYANLSIKAGLLEKQGKTKDAEELRAKAKSIATENELNNAAYALMADKKMDEAIAMFQSIVEKYPDSWNAHDSLGEALLNKGDKAGATTSYKKALSLAKDPVQKKRIESVLARIGS